MSYSGIHETSDLRTCAFGPRKGAIRNRSPLEGRFRHAPSPDSPFKQAWRTSPADNSQLGGVSQRVRDAIHDFNRRGMDALVPGSSRPKQTHAVFEGEGAEALEELLHRPPRQFGRETTLCTLEMAAEVSIEEGLSTRGFQTRPSALLWHAFARVGSEPKDGSKPPIRSTRGKRGSRPADHPRLGSLRVGCRDKEEGQTSHVERWINSLRQRHSRFVRKALSFSKSHYMHNCLLKLFIYRYKLM